MFVAAVLQGLASTALASGDQRLLPRANVLPVWEGLTEVDCRIVFEEIFERLEAERASGDPGFREPGIAMSCFTFPADQGNEAGQFYERAIAEGGWQAITAHLYTTYFGRGDEYLGLGFVPDWQHPSSLGALVVFSTGGKDSNMAGAVDRMKKHFGDLRQTQEEGAQPGPIPDSKGEIKKPD